MILVAWLNVMIENPFKNAGVVRDRTKKMLDKSFRRGYHGLVLERRQGARRNVWFRSASSLFGNVCQLLLLDFLPDSKNEFLLTQFR